MSINLKARYLNVTIQMKNPNRRNNVGEIEKKKLLREEVIIEAVPFISFIGHKRRDEISMVFIIAIML